MFFFFYHEFFSLLTVFVVDALVVDVFFLCLLQQLPSLDRAHRRAMFVVSCEEGLQCFFFFSAGAFFFSSFFLHLYVIFASSEGRLPPRLGGGARPRYLESGRQALEGLGRLHREAG